MVSLFVAITDRSWFGQLSQDRPEEVNFWQPSGTRNFGAVSVGELFLFKLHTPDDFIVGGGVFSHSSNVPLSLAWEAFGRKNGVASLSDMRQRIARYRRDGALLDSRTDPTVGCRILTQPFFLPREHWLPVPQSFARNIVTGKRYDTDERDGRYLWDAVVERANIFAAGAIQAERYGPPRVVRPRLGQGAFRLAVTDAYERRCAVSGERRCLSWMRLTSAATAMAASTTRRTVSCCGPTSTAYSIWDTSPCRRTAASKSAGG